MEDKMSQTMKLDELTVEIADNPDSFRRGDALSADTKAIIDPRDTWEIAFIHKMPVGKVLTIGYCFRQKDPVHYESSQDKWVEKHIYFLGEKLGRMPTPEEILEDAKKHRTFENHKLCYVLNFPAWVMFSSKYRSYERDLYWFLAGAQNLHPQHHPYFETIVKSSGFSIK
jgi:hypothetical protein